METKGDEVWSAFKALRRKDRRAVVDRLLQDREFCDDILDAATAKERRSGPSRPYEEFAEELRRAGRL
jgi:hypothetical protein